jgi:hypothetical protein
VEDNSQRFYNDNKHIRYISKRNKHILSNLSKDSLGSLGQP